MSRHVLKGIAVDEMVRTLRNTSCPGYFRMIKRILIKNCYHQGFPKMAIQATKRIRFGMREHCLALSDHKSILCPIPLRTKYCNYVPSVSIIFRAAWLRVFDDPVLSHYFPTAPFPVWSNHRNLKNILSYKNKTFEQGLPNQEYKDYVFQKFSRPKPEKRRKTL